jgi:hypothetical protein
MHREGLRLFGNLVSPASAPQSHPAHQDAAHGTVAAPESTRDLADASGKADGLPRRPPLSTARAAFTAGQRKQAAGGGSGLQAWRPALASEEFALAGCVDKAGLVTVG